MSDASSRVLQWADLVLRDAATLSDQLTAARSTTRELIARGADRRTTGTDRMAGWWPETASGRLPELATYSDTR